MKITTLSPTAHILEYEGVRVLISYETEMAFTSPHESGRRRSPSRTTGKHLSLAGMGDLPILPNFTERLAVVMAEAPLKKYGLRVDSHVGI